MRRGFPSVSIILPTYNRANLLTRSISSVLRQTYHQWELVIIDDGSTDNTREIVDALCKKDKRVIYHRHSNRGVYQSLNVGLDKASGEYATILASDDWYRNDHIELRIQYFKEHPDVYFIHGGVKVMGDEYVPDKDDPSKKVHISQCAVAGTFFGKREIFLDVGGFIPQEPIGGDADMLKRISEKYHTVKVDFPTYVYDRTTPDSILNSLDL